MSIPNACKTKEFVAGIGTTLTVLVVLMTSVILPGIDAQDEINKRQDEELKQISQQQAKNNVSDLKQFILSEFQDAEKRINENNDLILQNYRLLCQISEGNC